MTTSIPQQANPSGLALTGASLDLLKLIAMLLMVCDHVNETIFDGRFGWMTFLGRGAFPLFGYAMACYLYQRPDIKRYLQRMVVFALLSQPVFVFAFENNSGNVLFTFACGAIVGNWLVGEAAWRRHLLCVLAAFSSFFFNEVNDFGMVGILFPAVLACALYGDRFSWGSVLFLTPLLYLQLGDFFDIEDGAITYTPLSTDDFLAILAVFVVPLGAYMLCRTIRRDRFLYRYALYIFYPAHLFLLSLYRLFAHPFPMTLFS